MKLELLLLVFIAASHSLTLRNQCLPLVLGHSSNKTITRNRSEVNTYGNLQIEQNVGVSFPAAAASVDPKLQSDESELSRH